MAATYTQNITPFSGRFSATTMIYSFTAIFTAHDVLAGQAGMNDVLNHRGVGDWSVGDWAAHHAALPLYRLVDHWATNVFDVDFGPLFVECFPGQRQAFNTTTDNTMEVTVIMEGRVIGVHDISPRVQMTSEIQVVSLRAHNWPNPVPDIFDGLGLDFAGAPRDVPMEVYDVTECVRLRSLADTVDRANDVAGSVNEVDWIPPWENFATSPGVAEGEYLYLGATNTVVDRNTRTAMITHSFARLQSRLKQHIFEWFEYIESWDEAAKRRTRVFDPTTYMGYVQKVAGTDVGWSPPAVIPRFSTLLLGNIVF